MTDEPKDWMTRMVRDHYNPPPPTPREEIWARLEERLTRERDERLAPEPDGAPGAAQAPDVIPLASRRTTRRGRGRQAWIGLAASVVLAVGIGIGRWSRPGAERPDPAPRVALDRPGVARANRTAAVEHLSRSEPLLTLVKAEVSRGSVDPEVAEWARRLLGETRFLLDSGLPMDPEVVSLLEDLELVLFQATLVAGGGMDGERARQELELLEEGLTERNVLPRIQAVIPAAGPGFSGS